MILLLPKKKPEPWHFISAVDGIEEHDEEEQVTIADLVSKMEEYLSDTGLQEYSEETPSGAF